MQINKRVRCAVIWASLMILLSATSQAQIGPGGGLRSLWLRHMLDRAHSEQETIEWIRANGGKINYDFNPRPYPHSVHEGIAFDRRFHAFDETMPPGVPLFLVRELGTDFFGTLACAKVQRVTLSNWKKTSIEPLTNLELLEELVIHSKNEVVDMAPIGNLENLRFLALSSPAVFNGSLNPAEEPGEHDLSPLGNLVEMEYLYLDGSLAGDLSPLKAMEKLHSLRLSGMRNLTDLSTLQHLVQLKFFESRYNRNLRNYSGLNALSELEHLELPGAYMTDLSPLKNLRKLKRLNLGDGWNISDLSPLANLTEMEYLDLGWLEIDDLSPLENMRKLKRLNLRGAEISDLSPLTKMVEMEYLDLADMEIANLSTIQNLHKLKYLNLNRCYRISDVSPLAKMVEMADLRIEDSEITDLSPLQDLRNLKELSLRSCKGVSDLSPLTHLVEMEYLDLSNTAIDDLSPLANMKKLQQLLLGRTGVTDLTPLKNLTNLRRVVLSGNTKISQTEIDELSKALPTASIYKAGGGGMGGGRNIWLGMPRIRTQNHLQGGVF